MSQEYFKYKNKNENILARLKPTTRQLDYLTLLLDKELDIRKGSLIRTTFDFTLIVTSDDNNPNDTKKMNFIKFNKDSVLMFLELIYDEANKCLAAKVINNDKVCIISFATFEEMRNITAVTEANFIDFFSCLLIKWEP